MKKKIIEYISDKCCNEYGEPMKWNLDNYNKIIENLQSEAELYTTYGEEFMKLKKKTEKLYEDTNKYRVINI
jgi:hypothetical protein